jgi:hypothetical protein
LPFYRPEDRRFTTPRFRLRTGSQRAIQAEGGRIMQVGSGRHLTARKLLIGAVAAACVVGVCATSLRAAGPQYTGWSAPVNLGPTFNSAASDAGPAISSDGLSLYFHSDRPGGQGANDIWVSQRATVNDPWGPLANLGPTINTASAESQPAFSADGHWLFFASDKPGGLGGDDIYQSYRPNVHDDFGWQTPTNLGANVNSATRDSWPGYFEHGGAPQLYFATSGRPGSLGGDDVYVTNLQADGTWGQSTPVPELNSPVADRRPHLRRDGLELFLFSDRTGTLGAADVWVSTRATADAPWTTPVNLGAPFNSTANDLQAYVSDDGRTLVYASQRSGGFGNFDLYVTTRAAELTVTANDQSRLFGQANPPLTFEITGFVGGETASVVSGSAACSTTAIPSSPAGDYPLTCTVGLLSAPGYTFASFVAGTLTVRYSSPCLSGPRSGPLHVAAGEAACIGAGGSQTGPVTVAPGGSLDVEGGTITGPVVAGGAAVVRICGASITGPVTISGSTGLVLVGGEGCDPNTVVGPVRVTDNTGGVEVNGNRIIGPLRVTGNTAPVHAAGNTVTGPTTIQP